MKIKNKAVIYILLVMVFGFVASNYEPEPEVSRLIITFETKIVDGQFIQRYKVGLDSLCIEDCNRYADENDFEVHSAYSRKYGECMCKTWQ